MAKEVAQPLQVDAKWKQTFRRKLLTWYTKHERDLPWRKSSDPYRVWVSEVMLQQTQVETVKAYFQRFMKAFPTVDRLAAANEQDVLRLWEGLGYYRRARGLHAAAQVIVHEHAGKFPRDVATLMTLPGIGRYTAGAIVSIAYDQPAPILEANTIRLFARLIAYRDDPTKSSGQKLLWATAEDLLPKKNVARFNQALMELGSLVCKPATPLCAECPAEKLCETNRLDLQASVPASTKKLKFTDVREAAVVVRKKEKVLVRQCPEGGRWAGLWDFPRFAIEAEGPLFVQDELVAKVSKQTGITIANPQHLKTLKHGVTRFRITLDCFDADYKRGRLRSSKEQLVRWVSVQELTELPLSVTGRKLAKLVGA